MPTACLKWPPLHGAEIAISARAIVFSQDGKRKEPKTFFNYWKVINFRVHLEEQLAQIQI